MPVMPEGSYADPISILRKLIDTLSMIRAPLRPSGSLGAFEDDRSFNVESLDSSSLSRVDISSLGVRLDRRFVVVDGSSRTFSTPYFKLFMAGVAVYGTDPLHVYPNYLIGKPLNVDWGFVGIKVDDKDVLSKVEENDELKKFVRIKSVEEKPLNNYDDASVDDDVRMSLEAEVIKSLNKNRLLKERDVLVLDGPIYIAAFNDHKKQLANIRVKAIEAVGNNIPVMGVVKRVENSRKLCNDVVRSLINRYRVDLSSSISNDTCNDAAIIAWLGELFGVGYGEALILGPLKISSRGISGRGRNVDVSAFVDRVFWYVYTRLGSGVFRIETLDTIYERHKDLIDEVVRWLVRYIDDRGLPYIIDAADHYAKEITRGMYVALYSYSKSRGMNLDYETIIKALEMMHEVYSSKTQI